MFRWGLRTRGCRFGVRTRVSGGPLKTCLGLSGSGENLISHRGASSFHQGLCEILYAGNSLRKGLEANRMRGELNRLRQEQRGKYGPRDIVAETVAERGIEFDRVWGIDNGLCFAAESKP